MKVSFLTLLLSAGFLFVASPLMASHVLLFSSDSDEVTISQKTPKPWRENDKVCIERSQKQIACGTIISSSRKRAVVKVSEEERTDGLEKKTSQDSSSHAYVELVFGKEEIKRGDNIVAAQVTSSRETVSQLGEPAPPKEDATTQEIIDGLAGLHRNIASVETSLVGKEDLLTEIDVKENDDRLLHHEKLSNVTAGMNFIFPTFQYQQAVTDSFAPGIMPIYISTPIANGSISGWGGYLTLNQYSLEPFHGTWVQLGLGMVSLTGTVNGVAQSFYTPAIEATVGWRWFWESGLNFGFAVGGQYFVAAKPATLNLDYSGFFPSVTFDIGFAF